MNERRLIMLWYASLAPPFQPQTTSGQSQRKFGNATGTPVRKRGDNHLALRRSLGTGGSAAALSAAHDTLKFQIIGRRER